MATLSIKVVPGSKNNRIVGRYADGFKVQVAAPPQDGKANRAVIELLAKALRLKANQVTIVRGHAQPRKTVEVAGIDQTQAEALLDSLAG